jgi:hypothetical protein
MGVSVKAEWIERHKAEREEAEDRKARKIERGFLVAYAVSLAGASARIVMSL